MHQRAFALQSGADTISASLWPLSVDGLLLLATTALLKPVGPAPRRAPRLVWLAFLLGIVVSLVSNIAAAQALEWKPVLVAGWPPVALLLSVELLALRHAAPVPPRSRNRGENATMGGLRGTPSSTPREDPLLERARRVDARHREAHQRPVSADALRKELRIGTARSRRLIALLRADSSREPTQATNDTGHEQRA
ncbi:DUF2637 domain-containing protein [Streptomyces sp. BH055]|uniref:DUF2637 domain-containing protein n=1 Tax=Streptomyces sp. BH055 TaxID=3401173 RepID=UPI003BB76FFB